MLATKNPSSAVRLCALVAVAALVFVVGCTPAGPRAIIEADRALRGGNYSRAVEKLKRATELMPDEPRAWNLLGIAYHNTAQPQLAAQAYRQALARDRSNVVAIAHFNLGCLLLEENNPSAAADELRSFTLLTNSPVAWTKLGSAQMRLRQFDAAERSFATAVRIDSKNVEALNGLGVVNAQRNRTLQALQFFNAALQITPKYGPALLNSGLVARQTIATRHIALQRIREYTSIRPSLPETEVAVALIRQIESELNPPRFVSSAPAPQPTQTQVSRVNVAAPVANPSAASKTNLAAAPTAAVKTNVLAAASVSNTVSSHPASASPVTTRPLITNVSKAPAPTFSNMTVGRVVARQNATNAGPVERRQSPEALPQLPVTVVAVTSTPPAIMAVAITPSTTPPTNARLRPDEFSAPIVAEAATTGRAVTALEPNTKPGLLTRLNPFRTSKDKTPTREVGRVVVVAPAPAETLVPEPTPHARRQPGFPRYSYINPTKPPAGGNRSEAEKAMQRALTAQRQGNTNAAILEYTGAIAADPTYSAAQYNLALLLMDTANWSRALAAWETVLALAPESINARYSFALTLKQANYLQDAAAELEKILEAKPQEARAHLTLGNLYAQQLEDVARAREHYKKVLELDSRNPQAAAIRFWLAANQ